jgi:hypothetical protein
MTLADFFTWCGEHPEWLLGYFLLVPAVAMLAWMFSGREAHLSPWRYLFAVLIYMVAIPGIFAVTLNIYLFLFERRSIMDTNLFTQVIPVLSMATTFVFVRKQVSLAQVPGMDRLSSLSLILGALITMLWFIDRTHIYAITFMPFWVVVLILVGGFLLIRFGLKRLVK